MAPLTITAPREEVMDFSYSYRQEPHAIMTFLKPKDPFIIYKVPCSIEYDHLQNIIDIFAKKPYGV